MTEGGSGGAPEKVLGMFQKGGRIRSSSKGSSQGQQRAAQKVTATGAAAAPHLERPVVNCLGCGKIYDCRQVTNDILRFLEHDGTCTFCGAKVSLTHKERAAQAVTDSAPVTVITSSTEPGGEGAVGVAARPTATKAAPAAQLSHTAPEAADSKGVTADGTDDAAVAAAVAFKNRLVDYDRNSAQRTTVIDDQVSMAVHCCWLTSP